MNHKILTQSIHTSSHIKVFWEEVKKSILFWVAQSTLLGDKNLNMRHAQKLHTDQHLLFDSHHPLSNKLAIIRNLKQLRIMSLRERSKKEEQLYKENL